MAFNQNHLFHLVPRRRMVNRRWAFGPMMILVFLWVSTVTPVSAIKNAIVFSYEGEVYEEDFTITGTEAYDRFWQEPFSLYVGMKAFMKLNITIVIDKAPESYQFSCSRVTPPNSTINGKYSEYELIYFQDGEAINFPILSTVHRAYGHIEVGYNDNKAFPKDGFLGTIQIVVDKLGMEDNSIFRTEILLNSNESRFGFVLPPENYFDDLQYYGNILKIRGVLYSNSTTETSITPVTTKLPNSGTTFMNFTAMNIVPGSTQDQGFWMNVAQGDVGVQGKFQVALANESAQAWGSLEVFLLKQGTDDYFSPMKLGLMEFLLILLGIEVFRRKR